MTREEVKELLPILQAFAEGKILQKKDFYANGTFKWVDSKDEIDEFGLENYRIKPEPKYRPFANAEECWNEMLKHQPMLKCKEISIDRDVYIAIVRIKTDGIETDTQRFGFIDALKRFTFADGTPFGIKEESEG